MRARQVMTWSLALWLMVQIVVVSGAGAESSDPAVDVSTRAVSVLATVFAAPLKLATCVATVVLGGTAYGLTMGTSELLREELDAGLKRTCGGKYSVTPEEITRVARER